MYCIFLFLSAFFNGGNNGIDLTMLMEQVPAKDNWITTAMACSTSFGELVSALIAWGIILKYSCDPLIAHHI